VADGVHHRRVRAVRDAVADARLLAFELIPETAGRTGIIAGLRVVPQPGQFRG